MGSELSTKKRCCGSASPSWARRGANAVEATIGLAVLGLIVLLLLRAC